MYVIIQNMDIYIKQTLLSKATYNKYICGKIEKQYVAVSTVRTFIEPGAVR